MQSAGVSTTKDKRVIQFYTNIETRSASIRATIQFEHKKPNSLRRRTWKSGPHIQYITRIRALELVMEEQVHLGLLAWP
jgi:hypothetical protein